MLLPPFLPIEKCFFTALQTETRGGSRTFTSPTWFFFSHKEKKIFLFFSREGEGAVIPTLPTSRFPLKERNSSCFHHFCNITKFAQHTSPVSSLPLSLSLLLLQNCHHSSSSKEKKIRFIEPLSLLPLLFSFDCRSDLLSVLV